MALLKVPNIYFRESKPGGIRPESMESGEENECREVYNRYLWEGYFNELYSRKKTIVYQLFFRNHAAQLAALGK